MLNVRENDKAIMYYNSSNPEFKFQVKTKGENPKTYVYRNYKEAMSNYEKESENMIDLTKNNETTIDANEKENVAVTNKISVDDIKELIVRYTEQEFENAKASFKEDPKDVVARYFEEADTDEDKLDFITSLLEENEDLLREVKDNWESDKLYNTEFDSIEDLVEAYNKAKETLEEVASRVRDAFDELDNARDSLYNYM